MIVVHVTHEAVEKVGGIGAVIAGLMTTDAYAERVSGTILLGPLLQTDGPVDRRLGDGGQVIYSLLDALEPSGWREKFRPIERTYDVGIVYGTRRIRDPYTGRSAEAQVLLVDVFHFNSERLNLFKAELYRKFAVPSDRFENTWEFEQYIRLAEPGYEALKAIGCNTADEQVVILAHEYMGIPTALKAVLAGQPGTRTVFYAHEVASVREIIENTPGHDTMFYNVLERAAPDGRTIEQVFPRVLANFKHPLVKAARYCDHVFAVGDYIVAELGFLDPHFRRMEIDLVYNGVPAPPLTLAEKQASRQRMKAYAENLLGRRPTWVFTHVARPVLSKAIWRDLHVLHQMEPLLAERGETAVYFLLCTLVGQRRPQDIRLMERLYGWPVRHERGYPDLCNGEEILGEMFTAFEADHPAIWPVLVNQWDWNRAVCGERMPEDMTFTDIRRGTDFEFGLSVYEPFGISQFEPLYSGALCAVSNVCGCMAFARKAAAGKPCDDNILEGSFLDVPDSMSTEELLGMTIPQRDAIESPEARRLAELVVEKLPRDDQTLARRIASGHELANSMSWDRVVQEFFLPALSRVTSVR